MTTGHILLLCLVGLLLIGFDGFCLYDLVRSKGLRALPKPVWAVIVLISFPFGGILYLCLGRQWR
jgi:hypothetical protein